MNELTIEKTKRKKETNVHKEKWYNKFIQIIIPFCIAGLGMVGAGILFSIVKVRILSYT
jgi:hypothetical protein